MNEISNFFKDLGIKQGYSDEDKMFNEIAYVCISEFGWSQEDFMKVEIPFLNDLLQTRHKFKQREKEALNKKRR